MTRAIPLGELAARRHLPALDGLRAVSVFTVMAYHFGFAAVPGDLGVSAFFVLSGFLITWLLQREWDSSGTISLRRFYLGRTLRIFPAYYVFLAFSICVDFARGDERIKAAILPGLTYTVNYFNALQGHPTTSIAHAWSLAVEEQFYLVWPLLFLALSRGGPRVRRLGVVALIIAVVAWRSFLYLGGVADAAYVYGAFDTRFDNLAVGCWLALVLRQQWFEAFARFVTARVWYPLVTIVAILVSRTALGSAWHYGPGFTVDALLVGVLIVQLLVCSSQGLWRWLDWPVVRYLGTISYPLYLYHQWGLGLGHRAPGGEIVRLVVGVTASIVLASASYWLVERRFLRLKDRLRQVPNGPPAGPA